ncbi:DUF6538 domain-containing protein [Stutzerimonas stutzeri]|uniref:Integrase n=1 Tax=Stutzerimonas stutzeri TaxID=316 RepID=A0A0D9ANF9_STUST|nr:DUF6538 domain-containing protein [Stutzerimonas stutzeri]KJH80921.1 hypothetical protein UF78_13860 [Stutzerimonas stutzeri]
MADHIFQKKGESTWYVRLDIPEGVRHAFGGRPVLTQSLKTGLRSEAMERRLPLLAKWKAEIRDAREQKAKLGDTWRESLATDSARYTKSLNRQVMRAVSGPEYKHKLTSELIEEMWPMLQETIADMKAAGVPSEQADQLPALLLQKSQATGIDRIGPTKALNELLRGASASNAVTTLSLTGADASEAHSIAADPSVYKPRSPITQKRIEAFRLSQERKGIEPKTIDQMSRRVDQFSKYLNETGKPVSFDTVSAYLDQLTDKAGNALSSKTKKQHAWSCSSFWKWACKHDVDWREQYKGQPNPFADHDYPTIKGEAVSWDAFSKKDVERLHAMAVAKKDQPLADLIALGAYTGARLEEIGRIHRDSLTIKGDVPISFHIKEAKSAAGIREVPIHPKIAGLVSSLLEASPDGYLLPGGNNKYGNRLDSLSKRFGRLKTSAEYGKEHVFHSIRKTVITEVHRAGADAAVMPGLFGHETGMITFDLYSKGPSLEQKAKVIGLLSFAFP